MKQKCFLLFMVIQSCLFLNPGAAMADVPLGMLPELKNSQNADVTIDRQNNSMNVEIEKGNGMVGTLNWNSFNVGANAGVNFRFTGHNQTAFNKVEGTGMSQIYGRLSQSSSCSACGYANTSKVILLNPNGVLFGSNANVNLNSLTVSTMNGSYDPSSKQLTLQRGMTPSKGILVYGNVHADKGITFASDNVVLYEGSKLTTNVKNNVDNSAYGKVKIVTADGVNFTYYNNGAVKKVDGLKGSTDKMLVSVNGNIESGRIDIRNASNHEDSVISVKNGVLKATKAEIGNDGNIWLTSNGKILVEDSTIQTINTNKTKKDSADIRLVADDKISIKGSNINSANEILLKSKENDSVISSTDVSSQNTFNMEAKNVVALENNTTIKADDVILTSGGRTQLLESKINAGGTVYLLSTGDMIWARNSDIRTVNDRIFIAADNGALKMTDTTIYTMDDIYMSFREDILSEDFHGNNILTAKDISMETQGSIVLNGLDDFHSIRSNIILKAGKDIKFISDEDLIVGSSFTKHVLEAQGGIYMESVNGNLTVRGKTLTLKNAKNLNLTAKNNIQLYNVDSNGIQTNISAGNDINGVLKGVTDHANGLNAKAGNDITIDTQNNNLAISRMEANGDINLTVGEGKILAGEPYTDEYLNEAGDSSDMGYIKTGGSFNVDKEYSVKESQNPNKHHIEFESDDDLNMEVEKFLLETFVATDEEVTEPEVEDPIEADNVLPEEISEISNVENTASTLINTDDLKNKKL